jgi:cell division transport system ATP-binding protein
VISFAHVTKRFGDDVLAVDDVTFSIEPGSFVFLTGASGSGKSTILKLLTREYRTTDGTIVVNDTDVTQLKAKHIPTHRRRIGMVFQDYRLLPELNVFENIALPLEIMGKKRAQIEERITDLLELIDLKEKAFAFPHELSGGEAQRISIARALAGAPQLILADEPTGNLDAENAALIAKLLHTISTHGTTVIFATHDAQLLPKFPHKRLHIAKGKMKGSGSTENKTTARSDQPHAASHNLETTPDTADTPPTTPQPKSSHQPKTL